MRKLSWGVVCLLLSCAACSAVPVEFGGHYYEFGGYGGTWDECNAHAMTLTYQGLSGHLVTLNTEAEYNFLVACNFAGTWSIGWVGAYNDNGTYKWTNDEGPLETSTWSFDPMLNYSASNYGVTLGGPGYGSRLSSEGGSYTAPSIVEYEAIPEPATAGLFFAGFALLMRRRK